jgi:general stress protein YciG
MSEPGAETTVTCKSCQGTGRDPKTGKMHRACGGRGRTRPRGFATLPAERVREIARKGGVKAHAAGFAHEFSRAEASAAGKLGGKASQEKRRRARARASG